ncbi:MAG: TonB-dependent receptor [Exilibacterium sp.]
MKNKQTNSVCGHTIFQSFGKKTLAVAVMSALTASVVNAEEGIYLEEIIVTATPKGISKMDSSLSITTISAERAESFVPRGTVDILRSIPGIRAEATGGDSNGNITVRGVPLGGGGSKFLQLHEDGLPVLQFGDIIVGNADNYFTHDQTVKRVEAVKGSTAATLASNSPSGIINFVSKTGEEEGGMIGITTGLDYDTDRIDFAYGAPVGNDWSFHVGGFYRVGEGVRPTGFNSDEGGQIKLSVTKNFDNGHARLYIKSLDDQTATILPMPVTLSNGEIPGLDPRIASNIPAELINNVTTSGDGGLRESSIRDGNKVSSNVIGGEFSIELANDLIVIEKFRSARNSGKFFGAFSAGVGDATDPFSVLGAGGGNFVNALTEDALVTNADSLTLGYAFGLDSGHPLTDAELSGLNGNGMIQDIRTFDNDINSLDNFTNDLRLTKTFNVGAGGLDVTVGYYVASQDLDIDWYWQSHIADVQNKPRLLDLYSGAERLTSNGQVAFGAPQWGNCCTRDTAIEANVDAYYAALTWQPSDDLTLNVSIRQDQGGVVGSWIGGSVSSFDVDNDGVISFAEANAETITVSDRANTNTGHFDYDWSYTSYAFGANYVVSDNLAVFGNISEGGRANFDRLADAGFIISGQAQPGSVENTVKMVEAGVKYQGDNFGVFATAFYVETEDVNSESARGLDTPAREREFESSGIEIEATANVGDISLFGGLTWTDAEIVGSNDLSVVGNTPRRQPDLVYSGTASYQFGEDSHSVGISMFGRTDSFVGDDNTNKLDGYVSFNAFANFILADGLSLRLAVNNFTNELALTEAEGGFQTVNGFDVIRARSILGRTSTLGLRYEF